jgi:hypothetical protein
VLAAHPRVIRTVWGPLIHPRLTFVVQRYEESLSLACRRLNQSLFLKCVLPFQVHRLRKKPRPELPWLLELFKRRILEMAPKPPLVLASARNSCRVARHFSTVRGRIPPSFTSRLLRNLSGAGNARSAQRTLRISTSSLSGFSLTSTGFIPCISFTSTGRQFNVRLPLPPIPLRGALTKGNWMGSKQELLTDAGGAPPHNQRIEPTARRRHVACFRKRPAGARSGHPPALLLRRRASGLCSRLIRALYGRWQGSSSTLNVTRSVSDSKSLSN